jgi:hypothetical protein
MKTIFVNRKSELTTAKEAQEALGNDVYRTRLKCNCQKEFNRRNGIIVIDLTGHILEHVIRCKACAKGGQA